MSIAGRYYNGAVAEVWPVGLDYEALDNVGTLVIRNAQTQVELARWSAADLFAVHGRADELRIGASSQPSGARVVVAGAEEIARIHATIPALGEKHRLDRWVQVRIAATATVALAAVIVAYLFGVPIIANRVVGLLPPAWEKNLGDTAAAQMEASLAEGTDFRVCDTNPNSLANKAIARFGAQALEGSGSPFTLDIKVVKSDIPNAFALPGGKVYFFSALLDRAERQDEFAGVLAHEVGHVAYHHGMEQLISTAGTGALIGFILGDMTGFSVAASLGATIIDTSFSRDAERQADDFAAQVAQRLGFKPAGVADLLLRVGEDDDFSRALALFSTHPLTEDRKLALEALTVANTAEVALPFTDAEWQAIRTMCGGSEAPPEVNPDEPGPRQGGKTKNK
ncbi:M48 family metallopeptidase [Devosia sp. SL43]|uniref:M48 family metallopeptidase n=1 Tax=Devosia sp. SL43 TaxID=2806348 RepID=UPI001F3EB418|nr:M48 family metallopeptidase [Devosia sp. SL43]UJW85332.1 M48 family metallopeptidase [Devosia sp. SL43]